MENYLISPMNVILDVALERHFLFLAYTMDAFFI